MILSLLDVNSSLHENGNVSYVFVTQNTWEF